jgi:hypothetical protein
MVVSRNPGWILGSLVAALLLAASPVAAKLDDKAWTQAKRDLDQALAAGKPDAVAAAIEALGADGTRRTVDALLAATDKAESRRAVDAVVAALAKADADARTYMIELLEKKPEPKGWPVRSMLCAALAAGGGPETTQALAARLRDPSSFVISAAARALGQRKDKAAVEPLTAVLADLEKAKDVPWADVRDALAAIAGKEPSPPEGWTGPTFFGVPVVSKRVVFFVDVSSVMKDEDAVVDGKKVARLDAVKRELTACVNALEPDAKLNIVAFAKSATAWKPSKSGLVAATPGAKQEAAKWIASLAADGPTDTEAGLKELFQNGEANTVLFVTNGAPGRAPIGRGRRQRAGKPIEMTAVLQAVADHNRFRAMRLHTFCTKAVAEPPQDGTPLDLFDPSKFVDFLAELAAQNGGKFTKT